MTAMPSGGAIAAMAAPTAPTAGNRSWPAPPAASPHGRMPNPSPTTAHMRLSQFHLHTEKETPAEAEIASHRLLPKAGMLRRLAAGLQPWSPRGLPVMRRVEAMVRAEMGRAGGTGLLMAPTTPTEQ